MKGTPETPPAAGQALGPVDIEQERRTGEGTSAAKADRCLAQIMSRLKARPTKQREPQRLKPEICVAGVEVAPKGAAHKATG